MSNKIPTIGKIWLVFLIVISSIGIVANILEAKNGIIYVISALACVGELFGTVYLIRGKGINYFYVYVASYLVNGILSIITGTDYSISFIIGFVFGLLINVSLTYLAAKNTFKK